MGLIQKRRGEKGERFRIYPHNTVEGGGQERSGGKTLLQKKTRWTGRALRIAKSFSRLKKRALKVGTRTVQGRGRGVKSGSIDRKEAAAGVVQGPLRGKNGSELQKKKVL